MHAPPPDSVAEVLAAVPAAGGPGDRGELAGERLHGGVGPGQRLGFRQGARSAGE